MKNIVVFGAGMSASVLIDYLAELAPKNDWVLSVGDRDLKLAKSKTKDRPNTHAFQFDVTDEMQRLSEISKADIVVSMLPAHMHVDVAKECIALKKHMVTASYVSEEMAGAGCQRPKAAGVVIMNEIGVDPGIDHMSAMRVLDEIRGAGR